MHEAEIVFTVRLTASDAEVLDKMEKMTLDRINEQASVPLAWVSDIAVRVVAVRDPAAQDILRRVMALKGPRDYYELTHQDVGSSTIKAFGKRWPVQSFMGAILSKDVGKRIFLQLTNDGTQEFLQVENVQQFDERMRSRA